MKTHELKIMAHLRPMVSAIGALNNEPKKVPTDRILTIKDFCCEVMAAAPSIVYPVEK